MTNAQIQDLENRLHGLILPSGPIEIAPGNIIKDVELFIQSHLRVIKNKPDARTTEPFIDRLVKLIEIVENQQV